MQRDICEVAQFENVCFSFEGLVSFICVCACALTEFGS